VRLIFFINKILSNIILRRIDFILRVLSKISNYFITFHTRPKFSKDITVKFHKNLEFVNKNKSVAIVIQGPVIIKDNFTAETLKLYIKLFQEHKLILSTWSDSDSSILEDIKKLGIEIVLNIKPKNHGISNVNLQIVSTSAGIKRAKELGCEYVLKTRSDQRIYSSLAISLCFFFIKKFPLSAKYKQSERLVSFNFNTFKFRPYSISDMINFGHINDMIKYWCIELDERLQSESIAKGRNFLEWSKLRHSEVYFVTSFMNNINRRINWTLEDSWKVMSENFCILNINDIDLYWHKYSSKEFRHSNYGTNKYEQFNFADWAILQHPFTKKSEFLKN
jgi:hypothetical protein